MKKIICIISPFDYQQKVVVVDEREEIFNTYATLGKIDYLVNQLAEKYSIHNIVLGGRAPVSFKEHVVKTIEQEQKRKFASNKAFRFEMI